jgi:hypothetical protein
MDQYTRKIIGFGMHAGIVDGVSLCRMFRQGDPKATGSEVSQFRSRSSIPVPPMAGQSSHTGSGGNQNRTLRATLPSFRGTIDWHDSAGVPGPDAILDTPGLGVQTARLSGLLQPLSDAFSTCTKCAAGDTRPEGPCESPRLPMASTLWRFISNAHGRLMLDRRLWKIRTHSGGAPRLPGLGLSRRSNLESV